VRRRDDDFPGCRRDASLALHWKSKSRVGRARRPHERNYLPLSPSLSFKALAQARVDHLEHENSEYFNEIGRKGSVVPRKHL
jgi:hypothetical protein